MKTATILGLVACIAGIDLIKAACDNGCSGHGTCGADDVCSCYANWRMGDEDSGDCSDRVCPFEIAWVDTPNNNGAFHKYAECAGRGLCNRGTGECECFEGYTGKGCQRTTCPNDCSGHGTCEYIEEMPFGAAHGNYYTGNTAAINDGDEDTTDTNGRTAQKLFFSTGDRAVRFGVSSWDNHKTMGCVCDPRWTDVDCSRRMCPKGNDVLNTRLDTDHSALDQVQEISFPYMKVGGASGEGDDMKKLTFEYDSSLSEDADTAAYGVVGSNFALTFTTTLNETYTTNPIKIVGDAAAYGNAFTDGATATSVGSLTGLATVIKNELLALPHRVIDDVTVTVTESSFILKIQVTFTGDAVEGPQNLLQVEDLSCGDGCFPYLATGTNAIDTEGATKNKGATIMLPTFAGTLSDDNMPNVREKIGADYNNYECGRRGKCDYTTGLCECFDGYTGENCNTQTALL